MNNKAMKKEKTSKCRDSIIGRRSGPPAYGTSGKRGNWKRWSHMRGR
jgi:hypothetical protein